MWECLGYLSNSFTHHIETAHVGNAVVGRSQQVDDDDPKLHHTRCCTLIAMLQTNRTATS